MGEDGVQLNSYVISIIIPTLNEEGYLQATLAGLNQPELELIVVDGGSSDQTVQIAGDCGAKVFVSPPCRALQLNYGARQAKGDILLFLHGDTILPQGFRELILDTCRSTSCAGAFELAINSPGPGLRLIEKAANLRSRWLNMPYGDQALFMSAKLFRQVGGFPELPIMEDYVLVKKLRKKINLYILPLAVSTSGRRWNKLGVFRTTLINQLIIIGYLLGISLDVLADFYRIGKNG